MGPGQRGEKKKESASDYTGCGRHHHHHSKTREIYHPPPMTVNPLSLPPFIPALWTHIPKTDTPERTKVFFKKIKFKKRKEEKKENTGHRLWGWWGATERERREKEERKK